MNKRIRIPNDREHLTTKSMWTCPRELMEFTEWMPTNDNAVGQLKVKYSCALAKMFDEIFTNATDHATDCFGDEHPVTYIDVQLLDDGTFIITNDGPGIHIDLIEDPNTGKKLWSVEAAIGRLMAGSNNEAGNTLKGGTNGVGMKVVVHHCSLFTMDTCDGKLRFVQTLGDHPIEPRVDPYDGPQRTIVTFKPKYKELFYSPWNDELKRLMSDLVLIRCKYASMYLAAFADANDHHTQTKVKLTFNGRNITDTVADFAKKLPIQMHTHIKLKHPTLVNVQGKYVRLFWEIIVGIRHRTTNMKMCHINIVNGVYAREGGTIVSYFSKEINRILKERLVSIAKEFGLEYNNEMARKHMLLVIVGAHPNIVWEGQSKQAVKIPATTLSAYKIPTDNIDTLWSTLHKSICYDQKVAIVAKEKPTKISTRNIEKYVPANKLSHAGHKCTLCIGEGDSALILLRACINKRLGPDYYGTFSIQGVPVNARKNVDEIVIDTPEGPVRKLYRYKKLAENARLNALAAILGLQFNVKYQPNSLTYGRVAICTDEDLDGMGHICSLIVNFFAVFWPDVLREGRIYRWETPIMRATLGRRVYSFYSMAEFRKFAEANNVKNVKYFKGLSSHEPGKETEQVARDFEQHLIKFIYDDEAEQTLEIYYGKESNKRKEALRGLGLHDIEEPEMEICPPATASGYPQKQIKISMHLNTITRMFQLHSIHRKLKCCIDGLVPTQRKILAASRAYFTQSSEPITVVQLGGEVAKSMKYHHGDQSMNATISHMAQVFPGANNIPLLLPYGQFGNRWGGRNEHGSARYTRTIINNEVTKYLFPADDDDLLPIVYDDGTPCEPQYYVPILPLALVETLTTPGTGWSCNVFARSLEEIYAAIRMKLRGFSASSLNFKVHVPGHMKIVAVGNEEYCVGNYSLNEFNLSEVIINELPLQVWTEQYIEDLKKRDEIDRVESLQVRSDDEVCIRVILAPGARDYILAHYGNDHFDPWQHYFGLYRKLNRQLNMTDKDGKIRCFLHYNAVFEEWFSVREEYYRLRIERKKVLHEVALIRLTNIHRLIEDKIDLRNMTRNSAIAYLEGLKFSKFDADEWAKVRKIPTAEIFDRVLGGKASYKYLFDVKYSDTIVEKSARRLREIAKEQQELDKYRNIAIADLWLSELESLMASIKRGMETSWKYDRADMEYL